MNIGELFVRIIMDSSELHNQLSETRDDVAATSNAFEGLKTVIAGLVAGIGIVGGWKWLVGGNAQMEQYRQTLNIVMKDTQKAGELLEWATKFAAKTPFEIPDIVGATVKLQAYGIEAQGVLGDLGDMAAALGKPLMQAVEAVADAQTGELERLKEFGITKQMLIDKALELGKGETVNAQGQITNMQGINDALITIIRDRYTGAMEAQSTTLNGMISNLKDWLGTAGRILGEDVFSAVKQQLTDLLGTLNTLSSSGQLEQWGKSIGTVFSAVIDIINRLFVFVDKYGALISAAIIGVATSFIVLKTAMITTAIVQGLSFAFIVAKEALVMYRAGIGLATIAQWAFNSALLANPIGLVIAAIGALAAGAFLLYKAWVNNWGGIQQKTNAIAAAITSVVNRMLVAISTGFNKFKRGVFNLLDGIMGALAPVVGLVGKIAPGFEQGFDRIQAAVKSNVADIDLTLQELAISAEEASGKVKDAMAGVSDAFKPVSAEAITEELQELDTGLQDAAIAAEVTGAAVDGLGETLDATGDKASGAGGKATAAAEDTRAAWERTADRLSTAMQILSGEYDISAAKMGDNAGEAEKLALKNAHLTNQLELQKQAVAAVNQGYQASIANKKATAEETQNLQLRLVQEQKAQADLEREIRDTNKAIEEQGSKLQGLTGKVEDAASKYRNDLAKALEDYQAKVAQVNQKLADDESRLTERYESEVARRASALMNWVGLFDAVPAQEAVTGQELLGNLGDQVAAFENWQQLLADLAARGVDEGLIAELTAMGPQASTQLQALLGLTDDELSEYVLLWQQRSALATQQATTELAGLQAETQAQIAQLRADAAAQLAQYQQEWETRNREIRENTVKELETLVTEAERLGKAFADALTTAISAALPWLGFATPGGDQAGEAEEQTAGVIAAAQQQATEQAAIVEAQTASVITAWQDAGSQLATAQNDIRTQTVTTWQEIQQRLDAIWNKMYSDLVKSWAEKRAYIYEVLGQVDTRFDATVSAATNWGSNLIGNLISGIASRRGDLTNTLFSIAQEISNYLGFSSPTKKGPGRTADQWMPNLIAMMTGDLRGGIPSVRGAVSQLAAQMAKLAGIEPVISTRMYAPEAPALPKLPAAPPVGYKVAAEIERNDTLTRDVETQTAAIEVATPEIDVPTITPDIELQAAEVEVITPKPVKPQVDVPKVNIPDAQAATPRATPAIDAPAISPIVEQPTITPIVPRLEDTAATADIEVRIAELEVSTGSLQDDLATIFKAAATMFAKSLNAVRPEYPALFGGTDEGDLSLLDAALTKLTEGIEDELSRLSTVPQDLLNQLRTPFARMEAPEVAGSTGHSIGPIYITGSNAEEIWETMERKLHRLGVRW